MHQPNALSDAWEHYKILKQKSEQGDVESFKDILGKIQLLQIPATETQFYEACAWSVGKLVYTLTKQNVETSAWVYPFFECIRNIPFPKPSASYSFLFKSFFNIIKDTPFYLEFADWWGLDYFLPEDYQPVVLPQYTIQPLAYRAYMRYSKLLLQELHMSGTVRRDDFRIHEFQSRLDQLLQQYPNYDFLYYYKTRFLLFQGNMQQAWDTFIPFARKKKKDFWVWQLLAELSQDDDIQFACYCKALSLGTRDDYLVRVRTAFVERLIARGMFAEAKKEIEKLVRTYEQQNWKIPQQIQNHTKQEWFQRSYPEVHPEQLYRQYAPKADEVLYFDLPEQIVYVNHLNPEKGVIGFIRDKSCHGFFYVGEAKAREFHLGDALRVRFHEQAKQSFYQWVSLFPAPGHDYPDSFCKSFTGNLHLHASGRYGFVNDVYIDASLLKSHLSNKQKLTGRAILFYQQHKNKWSWIAISVEAIEK
ncbi:DUF7017 domain-containing protein [Thermoflavifilum thermophilum]|uniref:Uncharacterized protein n=1 Tax=Thermoflavifilum thermophilum TaxID=1393122 RepID=A0A1I7N102_9BACT|nr:hypothetical protein [Thermoflavifilum thermophilum]SFV28347.1 hypothetical protein SAMN05660895_0312 [Thermoflavifilum thermophilum]